MKNIAEIIGLEKKEGLSGDPDAYLEFERGKKEGYNQAVQLASEYVMDEESLAKIIYEEEFDLRFNELSLDSIHRATYIQIAKSIISQSKSWIVRKESK